MDNRPPLIPLALLPLIAMPVAAQAQEASAPSIDPYVELRYRAELERLQADAKAGGVGLWGACEATPSTTMPAAPWSQPIWGASTTGSATSVRHASICTSDGAPSS